MESNIGFIGCGKMGKALSISVNKKIKGKNIYLSNRTFSKAENLANQLMANAVTNKEVCINSKYIFICVEPHQIKTVFDEIKDTLKERKDSFVLVSAAAGVTIESLEKMSGGNYPIIRIMPNTPVDTGEGMIQYVCNDKVSKEQKNEFIDIIKPAGLIDEIPEELFDAASSVSGCGPAYAYMFISALAQGGVENGLPYDKALEYASQMVIGSAKKILSSKKHPDALINDVCTPGGSTIVGVHALETGALRSTVMNAVTESFNKNKKLGK